MRFDTIAMVAIFTLVGCTTGVESHPPRTATEELLISSAAERAAAQLNFTLPKGSKVFLDASNFEGTDSKNAVAAIRADLLNQGAALMDDKKAANIVIEIRSGGLSMNEKTTLIGIPQFNIPLPFTPAPLTFPEIALYKSEEQKGVAKFAAAGYAAKSGTLIVSQEPQYGFSHDTKMTLLFLFTWDDSDLFPDDDSAAAKNFSD